MFFGREADFELVRNRFQQSASGGLLVFCGERRSGKTSILFQILDGRLGPEFVPVLIDMQSMAIDNEASFLTRVAGEIRDALGDTGERIPLPEFTAGTIHAATFGTFIERILAASPGKKLLLLFDEYELFENKIDSGVLGEDILHILSSLMESLSVFLVFTGSQHLEARRREYWRILGKSLYRRISYLDRRDALNLIQRPVAGLVQYEDQVVEDIYRLTAGQPFYTQAVCQSLVDALNERHTRQASRTLLTEVVQGMVENPLPQMIFLWDSLERDEKLVLALLAEALADVAATAPAAQLTQILRQRQYPLDLGRARLSTVLEKLFRDELLLRDDASHPPRYSFRMDLWRSWIRRMHSVWQVIREEGMSLRPAAKVWWRRPQSLVAGGAGAAVLVVAVFYGRGWFTPEAQQHPGDASAGAGVLEITVEPREAAIALDGRDVGAGEYRERPAQEGERRFRLAAPGYAETTLAVRAGPTRREVHEVRLRPLLAGLRIETDPPGAKVTVDGRACGRSPVIVEGLPVPGRRLVEASLAGFGSARQEIPLRAGSVLGVRLSLRPDLLSLLVTSDPPAAQVLVDGQGRGSTPLSVQGIAAGRHRLEARREGFANADTVLEVLETTRQVHFALHAEPPGVLVVQGDRPAQIYVDGTLIVENVQNSRPQRLRPGPHQVRVVLVSGEAVEQSVVLRSGERATFDYSKNTVERRAEGGQ
jgi:hypothetical protein